MGRIHDALERAEQERELHTRGTRTGSPSGSFADFDGRAAASEELLREHAPRSRSREGRQQHRERIEASRRDKVMLTRPSTAVSDEYRTLRARIQSMRRNRELRSIVVTSALPREGKTTTSTNLAMSFGLEPDSRTCLVDVDMRTPALHRSFTELPPSGIAEVLESEAKLDEALVQVPDTNLWVLTVRGLPKRPSELLASTRMAELIDELHTRFDTVILDAPPVLGLPDATQLVDLCDAALLVVDAGHTPRSQVEATLQRIDARKVIGTVLNRASGLSKPYGYGGGA
jgi:capsular exopolysaccharide synthesis family protein